jgi:hypothetical protein
MLGHTGKTAVKKCPYCTADIPVGARKCKFCGEWVEPHSPSGPEPAELKVTVRPPTRGPTQVCPYCSAQIPVGAWACMYCKRGVIGGRPLAIGFGVLGVVIAVLFFFGFWLPGWMEVQRKHNDFDQEWNKTRRE